MNARMISDQLIDRSRSIWRMAEDQERGVIRAALLDITLDVAADVATEAMQLADQYVYAGPTRQLRTMRDIITAWRKVIRNVRAVNADHPIHEHHLYLVLLDSWGNRLNSYEGLFDPVCAKEVKLIYQHRFGVRPYSTALTSTDLKARKVLARSRIVEVLGVYAGR
jgi:hypothetical protein